MPHSSEYQYIARSPKKSPKKSPKGSPKKSPKGSPKKSPKGSMSSKGRNTLLNQLTKSMFHPSTRSRIEPTKVLHDSTNNYNPETNLNLVTKPKSTPSPQKTNCNKNTLNKFKRYASMAPHLERAIRQSKSPSKPPSKMGGVLRRQKK